MMLTSDLRQRGYEIGLVQEARMAHLTEKVLLRDGLIGFLKETTVKPKEVDPFLEEHGTALLKQAVKLFDIVSRPQVTLEELITFYTPLRGYCDNIPQDRYAEVVESAEILIKYQGYIERERLMADKLTRLENIKIRGRFKYETLHTISTEGRQKLQKVDPETIGQASRISGVSPSDINVLLVLLGR
jgi:tRNA uridine 5-carboxymethylaminomethyl modification enzyme